MQIAPALIGFFVALVVGIALGYAARAARVGSDIQAAVRDEVKAGLREMSDTIHGVATQIDSRVSQLEGRIDEALDPMQGEAALIKVKGIGKKRAQALSEVGIDDQGDLAEASLKEIAEAAGVSEKDAEEWQKRV